MAATFQAFIDCHLFFLCFSAAGGEIFNQCVADNDEAFTEKDVIRLARQILTGVAFLHRNNVVHLDLKVSKITVCTCVPAYVNVYINTPTHRTVFVPFVYKVSSYITHGSRDFRWSGCS